MSGNVDSKAELRHSSSYPAPVNSDRCYALRNPCVNIGVLGHVDSGKTALCRALSTVTSTASLDKSPQSKLRAITLDLGFSMFTITRPVRSDNSKQEECLIHNQKAENKSEVVNNRVPENKTVDGVDAGAENKVDICLVDCPGHASLLRTVIGGANIIDLILLVIDINKGIQNQTAECVVLSEIVQKEAIVVLNKIDQIPTDQREKKIKSIEDRLRAAFAKTWLGENVPMVPISANPGGSTTYTPSISDKHKAGCDVGGNNMPSIGINSLIDEISRRLPNTERSVGGPLCFAFDHCFVIAGQGSILTGTVLQGEISTGDVVEERGLIMSVTSPLPVMTKAIAAVKKVKYYKIEIPSKAKFHCTIGHTTVMCSSQFFIMSSESEDADDVAVSNRSLSVNPDCTYRYLPTLNNIPRSNVPTDIDFESNDEGLVLAVLTFEKPVQCCIGSLFVCSKLDLEGHNSGVRIAFYGHILHSAISREASRNATESVDSTLSLSKRGYSATEKNNSVVNISALRVIKTKTRHGRIDRIDINNASAIIGKDMFADSNHALLFTRATLWITISNSYSDALREAPIRLPRLRGTIEGPFGNKGKFRALFDEPILEWLQRTSAELNDSNYEEKDLVVTLVYTKNMFAPSSTRCQNA